MNTNGYIRPDPDELLASLRQEEEFNKRGKLKIFFGMCAGVGKTYTMLQTAQVDKSKGEDVIIGYIETHKRQDTISLLEGLEIISRKKAEYKGILLEEMDLDAIILRNPKIVLVDELAHTNIPGSRHRKRYQDVLELLDSGINVYTTLNVQHLESRTDTVSQITGIIVRESIPDEIFEKANEVELVDITPDELLERLSEGKVYTEEKSQEAIRNFFRKGNITALREMSLRIVADRVDKQLRQYMQHKHITGPWKSGMHLMVVIGPSPHSAKLVRWAKNLSYTLSARLLALNVETPKPLNQTQKDQLSKNITLAKELGAEFITTSGSDIVKSILSVAQKENITHIIIGKPRRGNLFPFFPSGNFIQRLIRDSGNIDVYILGSDQTEDKTDHRSPSFRGFTSDISEYIIASVIIILTAIICFPLSKEMGYQVVSFILLFVVAILATFLGIGPILVASTLSAIVWNYLFIPPRFTFHIEKTEDIMMFGMFFFIALVNGVLTSRVRKQERLTRDREERTNALFQLTKELSQASGISRIVAISSSNIKKHFLLDPVFILQDGNNNLNENPDPGLDIAFSRNEFSIASWTYKHSKKAGKFTDTLPSGEFTFYPLTGTSIKSGVLAIKLKRPFTGERELFWDTYLTQISNAIEREFLNELAGKARLLDESDKLYKALFNSISHELQIPVATIMGAADTLISTNHKTEIRDELSGEIFKASVRLNRLIENLLNMSRLESGHISPRLDWCDVRDLINKVSSNLQDELKPFNLHIVIPENMPLVKLDFGLMEQTLYNLVHNACQYAPPATNIRIKTYYDQGNFYLVVMDRGPGFPPDALPLVFNKFYRVEGTKPGGSGLGLSIVKGFVEAHKGTVIAENRKNSGARFIITIPSEIPDLNNIPKTVNE
jgi:two-component system sensor histidine kinase KdpD